jgi:hypothetical protein
VVLAGFEFMRAFHHKATSHVQSFPGHSYVLYKTYDMVDFDLIESYTPWRARVCGTLHVSCGMPGTLETPCRSSLQAERLSCSLPLPRSCNARVPSKTRRAGRCAALNQQDPAQIPRSHGRIPSTWVGLRLPACYRTVDDILASGAAPSAFQGCPRSSIHLLHQRFA